MNLGEKYLRITPFQRSHLEFYAHLLAKWNKSFNLAGYDDPAAIRENLIVDSIYLADFLESLFPEKDTNLVTWDLGAGAGLPGIPLRILWQKGKYMLVEARQKRAIFMENALSKLKLPDTDVFCGRVEKFFSLQERPADCILSRAFMPPDKLYAFCSPQIAQRGKLLMLSNKPLNDFPTNMIKIAEYSYPVADSERFFTALEKI